MSVCSKNGSLIVVTCQMDVFFAEHYRSEFKKIGTAGAAMTAAVLTARKWRLRGTSSYAA